MPCSGAIPFSHRELPKTRCTSCSSWGNRTRRKLPPSTRTARHPTHSPYAGQEIYLHLPNGAARTKLTNDYFDTKLGTISTGRNWRTVTKLHALPAPMSGYDDAGRKSRSCANRSRSRVAQFRGQLHAHLRQKIAALRGVTHGERHSLAFEADNALILRLRRHFDDQPLAVRGRYSHLTAQYGSREWYVYRCTHICGLSPRRG